MFHKLSIYIYIIVGRIHNFHVGWTMWSDFLVNVTYLVTSKKGQDQGRIQDFKIGGAHLKKLRRAEEGAKIFGVFRVKNFTPKNHIFFQF